MYVAFLSFFQVGDLKYKLIEWHYYNLKPVGLFAGPLVCFFSFTKENMRFNTNEHKYLHSAILQPFLSDPVTPIVSLKCTSRAWLWSEYRHIWTVLKLHHLIIIYWICAAVSNSKYRQLSLLIKYQFIVCCLWAETAQH